MTLEHPNDHILTALRERHGELLQEIGQATESSPEEVATIDQREIPRDLMIRTKTAWRAILEREEFLRLRKKYGW